MVTANQEMTCKELVELLTDYLEGGLAPGDRLKFEEHLRICKGCRIYLDHMRTTIRTLGKLREEFIPPQTRAELLRVFRGWKT
jgi:predicted anti-sigma-YlaC factor YlaD